MVITLKIVSFLSFNHLVDPRSKRLLHVRRSRNMSLICKVRLLRERWKLTRARRGPSCDRRSLRRSSSSSRRGRGDQKTTAAGNDVQRRDQKRRTDSSMIATDWTPFPVAAPVRRPHPIGTRTPTRPKTTRDAANLSFLRSDIHILYRTLVSS